MVEQAWPPSTQQVRAYRCCHAHDCCYGRLEKLGCEPKMERYLFSTSKCNVFCGERPAHMGMGGLQTLED